MGQKKSKEIQISPRPDFVFLLKSIKNSLYSQPKSKERKEIYNLVFFSCNYSINSKCIGKTTIGDLCLVHIPNTKPLKYHLKLDGITDDCEIGLSFEQFEIIKDYCVNLSGIV
jgi:hypothetical protein